MESQAIGADKAACCSTSPSNWKTWPTARRCRYRQTGPPADGGWQPDRHLRSSVCLIESGESKSFTLAPEQAFSLSNPDNIYHLDRASSAPRWEPKVEYYRDLRPAQWQRAARHRSGAVEGMSVTVDFNHPLAGHPSPSGDPGRG